MLRRALFGLIVLLGGRFWLSRETFHRLFLWAYRLLDVRDYGAVGDGKTDDSGALQAASDAAARDRKSMFLPSGTFRVSAPINFDVSDKP